MFWIFNIIFINSIILQLWAITQYPPVWRQHSASNTNNNDNFYHRNKHLSHYVLSSDSSSSESKKDISNSFRSAPNLVLGSGHLSKELIDAEIVSQPSQRSNSNRYTIYPTVSTTSNRDALGNKLSNLSLTQPARNTRQKQMNSNPIINSRSLPPSNNVDDEDENGSGFKPQIATDLGSGYIPPSETAKQKVPHVVIPSVRVLPSISSSTTHYPIYVSSAFSKPVSPGGIIRDAQKTVKFLTDVDPFNVNHPAASTLKWITYTTNVFKVPKFVYTTPLTAPSIKYYPDSKSFATTQSVKKLDINAYTRSTISTHRSPPLFVTPQSRFTANKVADLSHATQKLTPKTTIVPKSSTSHSELTTTTPFSFSKYLAEIEAKRKQTTLVTDIEIQQNITTKAHQSPIKTAILLTPESTTMVADRQNDLITDNKIISESRLIGAKQENTSPFSVATTLFTRPELLAIVIGGICITLLCAILLVLFVIYRLRKKDEGSYALDETKRALSTALTTSSANHLNNQRNNNAITINSPNVVGENHHHPLGISNVVIPKSPPPYTFTKESLAGNYGSVNKDVLLLNSSSSPYSRGGRPSHTHTHTLINKEFYA